MKALRWPIFTILLAYLTIGTLYAQQTPNWQAPDEPAHYNYIRQLAEGSWPVMEPIDYNQDYQAEVIGSRFDSAYSIEPFTYEDYQPPLYYLLQTPAFWLSDGDLTVLRRVGVALGGITLVLAFLAFALTADLLSDRLPDHPAVWPPLILIATIFFAFLPQHVALQASVNNDSLSELLIAAMLVWLLADLRRQQLGAAVSRWWQRPWMVGILLGLAFLTKVTAYLVAPAIGLFLLWRTWGDRPALWQLGWQMLGPAALLGLMWWGRNLAVYGWPDFLGTMAHDVAVVGQPTTAEWITRFGFGGTVSRFFQTTFRSFWGQFGWMGVVMDQRLYRLLALFSGLIAAGSLITFWRSRSVWGAVRPLLIIFLPLATLNLLLLVVYNFTYVQHQGRYLFASLIPLSLLVPAGVWGWLSLLPVRPLGVGRAHLLWVTAALLGLAFVALDLVALYWFILPQLA